MKIQQHPQHKQDHALPKQIHTEDSEVWDTSCQDLQERQQEGGIRTPYHRRRNQVKVNACASTHAAEWAETEVDQWE